MLFTDTAITTPIITSDAMSSFHLYIIQLPLLNSQKQKFFEIARNNGVGLNVHYIPIYHHPYFSKMGFKSNNFPEAEKYYSEAISIPMYADLSFDQQQHVASVLISTAATVIQ
jgi:dTDP-4-amino-4,6-dideoxygalactose transaminase